MQRVHRVVLSDRRDPEGDRNSGGRYGRHVDLRFHQRPESAGVDTRLLVHATPHQRHARFAEHALDQLGGADAAIGAERRRHQKRADHADTHRYGGPPERVRRRSEQDLERRHRHRQSEDWHQRRRGRPFLAEQGQHQRLGQFVVARRDADHASRRRDGIERRLQRGEGAGVDDHGHQRPRELPARDPDLLVTRIHHDRCRRSVEGGGCEDGRPAEAG